MMRRKKSRKSTVSPLHSQPFFPICMLMTVQHLRCYHQFPFPLSRELCPSFILSSKTHPPASILTFICGLVPPFSKELEAIGQHLHIYLNAVAACFHLPFMVQAKQVAFSLQGHCSGNTVSFLYRQFFKIFLPDVSHWHTNMVA